jgi:hypothetical protein
MRSACVQWLGTAGSSTREVSPWWWGDQAILSWSQGNQRWINGLKKCALLSGNANLDTEFRLSSLYGKGGGLKCSSRVETSFQIFYIEVIGRWDDTMVEGIYERINEVWDSSRLRKVIRRALFVDDSNGISSTQFLLPRGANKILLILQTLSDSVDWIAFLDCISLFVAFKPSNILGCMDQGI